MHSAAQEPCSSCAGRRLTPQKMMALLPEQLLDVVCQLCIVLHWHNREDLSELCGVGIPYTTSNSLSTKKSIDMATEATSS